MSKIKSIQNQSSRLPCFSRRGGLFVNLLTNKTGWLTQFTNIQSVSITLTTFSLLLCLFISSCSKTSSDPKADCVPTVMPPYTETGTNNIAFTMDGKVWVNNLCNYDHMFRTQDYKSTARIDKSKGLLYIYGESYPSKHYNESFDLFIPLSKTDLSRNISFTDGTFAYSTKGTKPPIINYVLITKLDTTNKIYCGKYDFTLFRQEPFKGKDSVHIIGFFDVREGQY